MTQKISTQQIKPLIKVGRFAVTGTGDIQVTGLGFKPGLLKVYSYVEQNVAANANAPISIGITDGVTQCSTLAVTRNGNGGKTSFSEDYLLLIQTIGAGGGSVGNNVRGTIKSFDDDGFTVNVSTFANLGNAMGFIYEAYAAHA